jgi:hypothetical protein
LRTSTISRTSGCSAAAASARTTPPQAGPGAFKKKVRLVFASSGSREKTETARANAAALEKLGVRGVYYESTETAHE